MNPLFVVAALLLAGTVLAQDPTPAPPPVPASPPATVEAVRAGDELLRALAAKSRDTKVLVANYVQRRTTKLSKVPLVSSGEFVFVREPGCVVFRAKEPRVSITRLRAETYEVYRPQKQQLERFLLDGPELANGLFAALGGDADALRRDFEVRSGGADPAAPGHSLVVLAPRTAAVRERLTELSLRLVTATNTIAAVSYRDASGDLVEIELRDVAVNPRDPPSVEFDTAEGTTIVEHRSPKR